MICVIKKKLFKTTSLKRGVRGCLVRIMVVVVMVVVFCSCFVFQIMLNVFIYCKYIQCFGTNSDDKGGFNVLLNAEHNVNYADNKNLECATFAKPWSIVYACNRKAVSCELYPLWDVTIDMLNLQPNQTQNQGNIIGLVQDVTPVHISCTKPSIYNNNGGVTHTSFLWPELESVSCIHTTPYIATNIKKVTKRTKTRS